LYTSAGEKPVYRVKSEVDSVGGRRSKRRHLAEVNNAKVTCLRKARRVLSPWQRVIYHHDNRSTTNHRVAGSHAIASARPAFA